MAKRKNYPIKYTSRDFRRIKEDLVQHAKRYYPNEFRDFSEASFGSLLLDSVSYIGDVMSFYLDYQVNESFLDSAIEYTNIRRHAENLGYKYRGSKSAFGTAQLFVMVPSNSDGTAPDFSYIPILEKGAGFTSTTGVRFTLTEDVRFNDPKNDVAAARFDPNTGGTTHFAIRAHGQVRSGVLAFIDVNMTTDDHQRFKRIFIGDSNISDIVSVTDNDGNEYHEVDYLTQEVVFRETTNPNAAADGVRSILKPHIASRRFVVEQNEAGTYLQFGYGSETDSETTGLVDPSRAALKMHAKRSITTTTFDPSNLITTNKMGISPSGKKIRVIFRSNETVFTSVPANTLNNINSQNVIFEDQFSLNSGLVEEVKNSIEVTNDKPITGDSDSLTREEIRHRAKSYFASQGRAVTSQDYESLVYNMPSKFGGVTRVNVVNDPSSSNRRLSMYVVSTDNSNHLIKTSAVAKNNIKNYLSKYKTMNDVLDILDPKIVNFSIKYSVVSSPDFLTNSVISEINSRIADYYDDKLYIGEPIYISELYSIINKTRGVVDVKKVEIENKTGLGYSSNVLDIYEHMSKDGTHIRVPRNVIMELKYPNLDIKGVIK